MTNKAKKPNQYGPVRSGVAIDRQLWVEFRKCAKERGVTLRKAMEDVLRHSLIKAQAEDCVAGDGNEKNG